MQANIPAQTIDWLANMKDELGRRKYSHQRGNTNGPLPTEAYVCSWLSQRKRNITRSGGDKYDTMNVDKQRKCCIETLFNGQNSIKQKAFVV